VKIPQGLKEVGVLLEPTTVVEKGIAQAYEIQRRLRVWRPRRAAVMGAGTIGLLATLACACEGCKSQRSAKRQSPISTRIWLKQLAQPTNRRSSSQSSTAPNSTAPST